MIDDSTDKRSLDGLVRRAGQPADALTLTSGTDSRMAPEDVGVICEEVHGGRGTSAVGCDGDEVVVLRLSFAVPTRV